MSARFADALGLVAGLFTTVAFVPQVVRVWRTRQARDISLWMFLLFSLGVALWLAYGLMIRSLPVVAANGTTLLFAVAILVAKLRFG